MGDPRDAVVIKKSLRDKYSKLSDLPKGSLIGSSSLRRQAQLKKTYRDHLEVQSIRGNLNTRLRKLDGEWTDKKGGEVPNYTAIILATAGLNRMASQNAAFVGRLSSYLEPEECMYAVGQGALAVEIVENDTDTAQQLQCLHHEATVLKVVAERAFMKTLDGGCSSPIAVHCFDSENMLTLKGAVFSTDGSESLYDEVTKDISIKTEGIQYQKTYTGILVQQIEPHKMHSAYELGVDVANRLFSRGAGKIIAAAKAENRVEINPVRPECPFPLLKNIVMAISLFFSLSIECPVNH